MQSTYGNDERFKIDERFIDEDETSKNNVNDGEESNAIQNYFDEKTSQLKILDGVLGESSETSKSKKPKKRYCSVVYLLLYKF